MPRYGRSALSRWRSWLATSPGVSPLFRNVRAPLCVCPNAGMALRRAGVLRATILMAPPLMSALATRWIADGSLDEIAKAISAENAVRQKLAASILRDVSVAADPHGHHLWLRLPTHWRAGDFAEHADRVGVSIVPSSAFAVAAHPTEAVRISLGVAPDRGALEDGLTQLASLMAQPSLATRAVV
jgi:DNA-binding transcriptional MocR family regulator